MGDVDARLLSVFGSVFPKRTPEQLLTATQNNTPAWDSIATITLIGLIEEEFNVSFELDRMENLTSFQAIRQALEEARRSS